MPMLRQASRRSQQSKTTTRPFAGQRRPRTDTHFSSKKIFVDRYNPFRTNVPFADQSTRFELYLILFRPVIAGRRTLWRNRTYMFTFFCLYNCYTSNLTHGDFFHHFSFKRFFRPSVDRFTTNTLATLLFLLNRITTAPREWDLSYSAYSPKIPYRVG